LSTPVGQATARAPQPAQNRLPDSSAVPHEVQNAAGAREAPQVEQ
jgi:hypothetical protein